MAARPAVPAGPALELHVMSLCPLAARAEQILLPLIEARGLAWQLYFIAAERTESAPAPAPPEPHPATPAPVEGCEGFGYQGGGRFASLHGPAEVEEDLRQASIAELFPAALSAYLLARADDPRADWRAAARRAGLDPAALERLAREPAAEELLARRLARAAAREVTISPTMIFNQRVYRGGAGILELARTLCRGAECDALPACAQDADCAREGRTARCISPLAPAARCELGAPLEWTIVAIPAAACPSCRLDPLLEQLAAWFPAARLETVAYPGAPAESLIERYGLTQLPALLFDREVEGELHFDRLRANLVERQDRYLLDPRLSNVAQLLGREPRPGRFELFADSRTEAARQAELEALNYLEARGLGASYRRHPMVELEPSGDGGDAVRLSSPYGAEDLLESTRRYCAEQAAPELRTRFPRCRLEQPQKSWQECLGPGAAGLAERITECAAGAAVRAYLEAESKLREQLEVVQTPSYLIDNFILVRGLEPQHAFALYEHAGATVSFPSPAGPAGPSRSGAGVRIELMGRARADLHARRARGR